MYYYFSLYMSANFFYHNNNNQKLSAPWPACTNALYCSDSFQQQQPIKAVGAIACPV
jgi:hypothetical protein